MNSDPANGQWIAQRDLPERLGCAPEVAQQRLQRGRWRQRTTADGRRLVLVPTQELPSLLEAAPVSAASVALAPSSPAVPQPPANVGATADSKNSDDSHERGGAPDLMGVYGSLVEELRRRAETAETRAQTADQRAERFKRLLEQTRSELDSNKQQQRLESKAARNELQREREARAAVEIRLAAVEEETLFLRQLVIDYTKSNRQERRWRLFGRQ